MAIFTGNRAAFRSPMSLKPVGKTKEDLPLVEEDQVRGRLNKVSLHKCMQSIGMHS